MKKYESGRSMVEMLGVLAIMGVLSIGGIMGYNYAIDKHRANETIKDVTLYALSASTQAQQKQATIQFSELGTTTSQGYTVSAQLLEDPTFFEVYVSGVPTGVCEHILKTGWQLPLVIFANGYAYKNETGICDTGDGTLAEMAFQFKEDLNQNSLPLGGCVTDDDCKGGCMKCEDKQCVSSCVGSERCATDQDTGVQICCPSEKRAGPMCCDSTKNGWCCNADGQCCPWHKPLVDKDGNCYACDNETGVNVTGVEDNCGVCSGREVLDNSCVQKCPGDKPLRGRDGKCYACDEEKPVNQRDTSYPCTEVCPNRIRNGASDSFCSFKCGTGTFTDLNGKCQSCEDTVTHHVSGVSHEGCEQCTNRTMYALEQGNKVCVLDCPSGFRGDDGECYDCDEKQPIAMRHAKNECSKLCTNRVAYGAYSGYCALPCKSGEFADRYGECHPCSDENVYDVFAVENLGCGTCTQRETVEPSGTYVPCILKCNEGYIRDSQGICQPCDSDDPILINESAQIYCTEKCPKREYVYNTNVANNVRYCSKPCNNGEFMRYDGTCYPCNEPTNIISALTDGGCSKCSDTRNLYNNLLCVPKCPAETPLRGSDNKCYACDEPADVSVSGMTDACYECPNERKLDGVYCVLK